MHMQMQLLQRKNRTASEPWPAQPAHAAAARPPLTAREGRRCRREVVVAKAWFQRCRGCMKRGMHWMPEEALNCPYQGQPPLSSTKPRPRQVRNVRIPLPAWSQARTQGTHSPLCGLEVGVHLRGAARAWEHGRVGLRRGRSCRCEGAPTLLGGTSAV